MREFHLNFPTAFNDFLPVHCLYSIDGTATLCAAASGANHDDLSSSGQTSASGRAAASFHCFTTEEGADGAAVWRVDFARRFPQFCALRQS